MKMKMRIIKVNFLKVVKLKLVNEQKIIKKNKKA